MKFAAGTRISFPSKGQELSGIILSAEGVVVKLDSGYNITVKPGELKEAKELKVEAKKRAGRQPRKAKDGLPRIQLLHTGGTVASRVDYSTGAVIAQYTAEELLELYPELLEFADVRSRLLSNMQSEMMRFAHWNIIAKAVADAVADGVAGVIVTHGTDTLAMTAAALAFALRDLPVPVLLVGSQRSSDRPSSDAVSNLLCATAFIAGAQGFAGVAICMHEGIAKDDCVILPACRTRKMHTSRRDAFRAINDTPYARIAYPGLGIERLREYPAKPAAKPELLPFNEKLKVGLLPAHPQMYAEELLAYQKFDGLVFEVLGIGHAPTMQTDEHNKEHERILAAITTLAKRMPVAAAPQTIYGRVDMDVYTPGRHLIDAGVLGQGLDMTPETAFVKLAWLLSNYEKKEVKQLYGEDLRGELSARSEEEGYTA